jgi:large subunit ribosomal protein L20
LLLQLSYSKFITGLSDANITLNRKVLSELAMTEPFSFKALVDQVSQSLLGHVCW